MRLIPAGPSRRRPETRPVHSTTTTTNCLSLNRQGTTICCHHAFLLLYIRTQTTDQRPMFVAVSLSHYIFLCFCACSRHHFSSTQYAGSRHRYNSCNNSDKGSPTTREMTTQERQRCGSAVVRIYSVFEQHVDELCVPM